jgi:hypothetical protein
VTTRFDIPGSVGTHRDIGFGSLGLEYSLTAKLRLARRWRG